MISLPRQLGTSLVLYFYTVFSYMYFILFRNHSFGFSLAHGGARAKICNWRTLRSRYLGNPRVVNMFTVGPVHQDELYMVVLSNTAPDEQEITELPVCCLFLLIFCDECNYV